MQEHNDQCRELVGKDYALITVRRYESCKRYLAELIRLKYDKEDLPLSEVNGELVRAFEFYLKTEKSCQQNTVIRYMKCLKKITNLALANRVSFRDALNGINAVLKRASLCFGCTETACFRSATPSAAIQLVYTKYSHCTNKERG